MANPTNNTEPPNVDSQMNNKHRKKKSIVWEHFTIETIDAGCTRARCMQCKKSFAYISGSKLAGTSHLKRHISLGICPVSRINEKNGQIVPLTPISTINVTQDDSIPPRKRIKRTSVSGVSFYQDHCRQDIAKMIIMHEYPLNIVEFVLLPFPDSESALNHAVLSCVADWNLEHKLLAVTLDETFANKAVRKNLRHLLSVKNPLILNGKFLIGSCYAQVLCRLAQDALRVISETVKKVRDSVKYVVTVKSCQERFNDLRLQLQVPSAKSLVLDDQSQWNTTYHMLAAACELKEVFSCLDTFDSNYRITLTMEEWKQVEILCTFLKLLLDAADLLIGPSYPTANAFFHEAWKIQLELKHASLSEDVFIKRLTRSMHERFNKYWKECFLVFSIAVVMDPRFKMKLVEFSFSRIYGEDADHWIKAVSDGIHELFLDYVVQMLPPPTFVVNGNEGFLKTEIPQEDEETILHCEIVKTETPENEIFLSTSDELSDFDCKKMDRYRCSLKPSTLEALVCAKDWLQNGTSDYSPSVSPKSILKTEL
ncbi:hypothetical protein E3N88_39533 [Mikania micrantha]|uniref:BED-type domain-containing protein n=1 Tax=Mikania micrantha TaxID=192012 RepID=A0A5N6LX24_9ASTR|nr:hypothetical protein E3N88_39533 [Mikania micrantha]